MEPMLNQLTDAQQSGVYRLAGPPEEIQRAAQQAGLAVFRIDLSHAKDKKDFLALVANALSFPNWFGKNWDAWNDLLTDLDWLTTKTGYVLIFDNGEHFGIHRKDDFDAAIAVLGAASEFWKDQRRPFWVFIVGSGKWDAGLPKWPPS